MRRLLPSVANAAFVLAVQLLALVTLSPSEFGAFSLQYLLFALASSLALSLISEAWLRADLSGAKQADWREYSSTSLYWAIAAGAVTLAVSLALEPLRSVAALGSLAVAASTYRGSARYHAVRTGYSRGVLPGDAAGFLVAVGLWAALFVTGNRDLSMIVSVWAAASVASALFSAPPHLLAPRTLIDWVRQYWPFTRVLLSDSLLSNVSSVGTPYVLAPMLGLSNFGVYRAVSNVAAPVRLLLTPIAPQLGGKPLAWHRAPRRVALMLGGSASFGILAYLALVVVGALDLDMGALSALVPYAVATGVFVAANFVGHYLSIVARAHMGGRKLITGRTVHALLGTVLPIVGAIVGGLPGAIWGYTASIVIAGAMWMILVLRRARA